MYPGPTAVTRPFSSTVATPRVSVVQLSAEFEPADADLYTALRWTTDTRGVATVDENGLVTAVGPGYTYIRATSTLSDYPEGYCDVTVENGE